MAADCNNPLEMLLAAQTIRKILPPAWESHVTEWNVGMNSKDFVGKLPDNSSVYNTTRASSLATGLWIAQQTAGVNVSTMYWGCCAKYPYTADIYGMALFHVPGKNSAVGFENKSAPLKPSNLRDASLPAGLTPGEDEGQSILQMNNFTQLNFPAKLS